MPKCLSLDKIIRYRHLQENRIGSRMVLGECYVSELYETQEKPHLNALTIVVFCFAICIFHDTIRIRLSFS